MPAQEFKFAGISDEAVRAKTGKGWKEWIAIVDIFGARKMAHKDISKYLYKNLKVSGWWCHMVTVGYEQARGLREKHQTASGHYDISVSRTLEVPVSKVLAAWQDEKIRGQWLSENGPTIRKVTANK